MSHSFWLFLMMIFGLAFGSFLNVVICRIDELETIFTSRSHCPKCLKQLAWYDLVPFISFIILKTKCRYCRAPISWQYPIVELATSIILALSYWYLVVQQNMSIWAFLPLIITLGALIVCFVYDAQTMTLPLEIIIVGSVFTLISYLVRFDWLQFSGGLAGALVMAAVPAIIIFIGQTFFKKEVMGVGDIFLAASIGLILNFQLGILAMMISFILGGIISIILILMKKIQLGRSEKIAFGPFLIASAFVVLFWGQKIFDIFYLT